MKSKVPFYIKCLYPCPLLLIPFKNIYYRFMWDQHVKDIERASGGWTSKDWVDFRKLETDFENDLENQTNKILHETGY